MLCSNSKFPAVALIAVLLFSGCVSNPSKEESEQALSELEGDTAVPFVLIPSPYQPTGTAPKQAKQEFAQAQGLMKQKQWEQAESTLLLMTETYPELSGPYVNLGIVYIQTGKFDEAVKALEFALETNATNMDAYSQLGLAYREQGLFEQAEATYLRALEAWPHDPSANRNLGILYDLYLGRFAEALERYKLLAQIQGEPTRELRGWIIDLERRIASGDD